MVESLIDFEEMADLAYRDIKDKYSSLVVTNQDLSALSYNLKLYGEFVLEMQRKTAVMTHQFDGLSSNKDAALKVMVGKMKKHFAEMKELIEL